jgi:hypothetical protein
MPYNYPGFTLRHPFPEPRPRSRFGWHGGADYAAEAGTPVPAMYAGKVWRSGFINGYGMAVIVRTDTAAGPIYALYGHLGPNGLPAADTEIKPGKILGEVASREYNETFGLHYNPHLHLEIISNKAQPARVGRMGGVSSDIIHRANPETFDINDPRFPYENEGPPPRPAQKGVAAKPSDSPPLAGPTAPIAPPGRPPARPTGAPAQKPSSRIGAPLDLTPQLPPTDGYAPQPASPPDPTGSLYFSPQPSPPQFGPFTWPGAGNSRTDRLGPPNGFGGVPGTARQSIDGDAADQTGNDSGGVWTTAQQYMAGQTGRMTPPVPPSYGAPRAFPVNRTQAIDTIGKADLTGTQPVSPVQNLTLQTLRMKGVPEADIGAAIDDPRKMQQLLNQLYGSRSAIASGSGGSGFGRTVGQDITTGQPDQTSMPTATPDNYLPFGWSGLPPLLR